MTSKYITKAIARFNSKYNITETGCWEWTSVLTTQGRPRFYFNRKDIQAHRFSAEYLKPYPLRDDEIVCHHCDNPVCVNPEHLFIGTQTDNLQDMLKKNRSPHTALTIETVRAIREDSKTMSPKMIREKYQITKGIAERIKSGRSFKHI